MHPLSLTLFLSILTSLAATSTLPINNPALHKHFQRQHDSPSNIVSTTTDTSLSLLPRMDVLDPGDILPGGRHWSMSLMKFIPFGGVLFDTSTRAATQTLKQLYTGALDSLQAYPPGNTLPKNYAFFTGELLSFMVQQVSGSDPMTVDMLRGFLAHVLARLAMGGYRGIYVAFLRQGGTGNMFSVKLQSNPYWVQKGIGDLPGMVGLAAMGF